MGTTDTEQPIRLVVVDNPLDRNQRRIFKLDYTGASLEIICNEYLARDPNVAVSLDGHVVDMTECGFMVPKPGTTIVIVPCIGDPLSLIWGAATAFAGSVGAYVFSGQFLVQMAVGAGLGLLVSALTPKPKLSGDFDQSQAYSWNPHTLQQEGHPIAEAFGKNLIHGNIIACHTEATDGEAMSLRMLVALCEGPIEGITKSDGTNYDIFLNGQPISNFPDVTVEVKNGTTPQAAGTLFAATKPEYRRRETVTNTGGAYTYIVPDDDYDDLEITLAWPQGLCLFTGDSVGTHTVGIKIEIDESDGSSWHTLVAESVAAGTTATYYKSYTASGTYTGGSAYSISNGTKYKIRITKTTSDESGTSYRDNLQLFAVREIITDTFGYPGIATVAISAIASSSLSGAIEFSCIAECKIVEYYSGGAWTIGYNRNPAWCLYAVATGPIITGDGDGTPYAVHSYNGYAPSRVNTDDILALEAFHDTLVDDGEGGTEARTTFDAMLDTHGNRWQKILQICEVARCVPYFEGNVLRFAIDKARSPVQTFNVANIIEDKFRRTVLPVTNRASEIELHFRDEFHDFQRTPLSWHDTAATWTNKVVLQRIGINKASRAWRAIAFEHDKNEHINFAVQFDADMSALGSTIGDVVYVQHPIMQGGKTFGGRVVSATATTVRVDQILVPPGGTEKLIIQTVDENNEVEDVSIYTVTAVEGNEITISGSWDFLPKKGDFFAYGTEVYVEDQIQIIKLRRAGAGRVTISGLEYSDSIYNCDSDTPVLPELAATCPRSDIVGYRGPTIEQITDLVPAATVGFPTMDALISSNLLWSGNDSDTVSWAKADGTNPIIVLYKGVGYEITADSTTDEIVYWDVNDTPTTFLTTNSLATALGVGKWVVCRNHNGVAYPAWMQQILHGGLIQADTVTAGQILVSGLDGSGQLVLGEIGSGDADDIAEGSGNKFAAESGADVTSAHQAATVAALTGHDADDLAESAARKWAAESGADITGDHEADISIDNIADGSTHKKLTAAKDTKVDGIEAGADVTADHAGDVIFYSASAPGHVAGRLWYDTNTDLLKRSTGAAWQTVGDETALHQADIVLDNVQDGVTYVKLTAAKDTKVDGIETGADVTGDHPQDIILYGSSDPGHAAGRLWFDTNTELLKRSTGAAWQTVGDETAQHEADISLANLGEKSVDSLVDGSTYAKMLKTWRHTSDTTYIDGGKIYTNSITATQIAALTITAAQIAAGTITADELAALTITAGKISANAIETDKLNGLAVTTAKVGDNAISDTADAYTAGAVSISAATETTIQSVAFTTTGATLMIQVTAAIIATGGNGTWSYRIYRGSTSIYDSAVHGAWTGINQFVAFHLTDTPSSGTYTYYVKIEGTGDRTADVKNRSLYIQELKK